MDLPAEMYTLRGLVYDSSEPEKKGGSNPRIFTVLLGVRILDALGYHDYGHLHLRTGKDEHDELKKPQMKW